MRVHTMQGAMSLQQADILEAYLNRVSGVTKATVYDRTGDAVICYDGPRETVTKALSSFAYAKEQALAPEHSSRALNRDFEDKLVASLCWRGIKQLFVPSSVRTLITVARSVPYIKAGLTCLMHRKIQVPVLDATAITVSMLRKDFTVSDYQLYQSRLMGADCVLLICALLDTKTLTQYLAVCDELGLSALVETHDADEICSAIAAGAKIIGVNNRNLKDFSVAFSNAARLRDLIPPEAVYVAESGVQSTQDVAALRSIGADAVLIGETLMRAPDKARRLAELRGNL